jgi:putative endonuclease
VTDIQGFSRQDTYLWGILAEWLATILLFMKGYSILDRRWRSPVGEIDLIVKERDTVVFVEVKARPTREKGLEAISPKQRGRIENAAGVWLASHSAYAQSGIRFDCVVVSPWKLPHHVKDAWRPVGRLER